MGNGEMIGIINSSVIALFKKKIISWVPSSVVLQETARQKGCQN